MVNNTFITSRFTSKNSTKYLNFLLTRLQANFRSIGTQIVRSKIIESSNDTTRDRNYHEKTHRVEYSAGNDDYKATKLVF